MFWCFGKNPKTHHCKIVLLDETEFIHEFQDGSCGQQLLDVVFKHLNLMETAYFGLRYLDTSGQRHWLDPNKNILKQLKGLETFTFYFGVKFYASDPCKLLEEITRYQFFLQVKQDIYQGRLPLTFDLAAELFAYTIQSELGDYDPRRNLPGYTAEFRFSSNQTAELEAKVSDIHKSLSGRVPSIAELSFLDRVKWLDMYGVDLHPVLGEDNIEYFLGLTPSGILVLRNKSKVGNYFWPRISKVFFKRKYFMLRVKDKNNEESTYGFELPNKQACKHLWKCCIEHRGFFKLTQIKEAPGQPGKIFGIENKFTYSGWPEKNIQMTGIQARLRTPPTFIRVPSRRYQKRLGQPDGADAGTEAKEEMNGDVRLIESRTPLIPSNQPILIPSLHRSTSVPSVTPVLSPYKMPPWEDTRLSTKGLYSGCTNPSPRSVRSAGALPSRRYHNRSGSIDSSASCDYRKRKHHSRRQSDNESEISKSSRCSKNSRSSRNGRHRSQSTEGSDSESQQKHRRHSRRRKHGSNYDLVESESQWREVQQQNLGQNHVRMQNAVVRDLSKRRSGYMNSGLETESETNYSQRRRHRRHQSRSRSPDSSKAAIPSEVKKYIEYNLIDPSTLTEEERRNIKYTKVQSDSRYFKIRYSPPSSDREHHNENHMVQLSKPMNEQGNECMKSQVQHMNGNITHSSQPANKNENNGNTDFSQRLLPQIPKLNANGVVHNGCLVNQGSSLTNFAEERARLQCSNPNLMKNWNQNRSTSTFERKSNKENVTRNSDNSDNSQFVSPQERMPSNLRMVNGHYYPAPLKPPASLPSAPRVTFQDNLNQQPHYPKTFSSSQSCSQFIPRQNGEVPKSVANSQNHEMSTEL